MDIHTFYYENLQGQETIRIDDGTQPYTFIFTQSKRSLMVEYAMGQIMFQWGPKDNLKNPQNMTLKEVAQYSPENWANHTIAHSTSIQPLIYQQKVVKEKLDTALKRNHCDALHFNAYLKHLKNTDALDLEGFLDFKSYDDFTSQVVASFNPFTGFDTNNRLQMQWQSDSINNVLENTLGVHYWKILNKMTSVNPKIIRMHKILSVGIKQKPDKVVQY